MKFIPSSKSLLLLLVAALLTTSTLLWAFLPELMRWQLASRLADRGFELTVFNSPRLAEWQLKIRQVEIESETLRINAADITLNLFGEYRIQIERVDLDFKSTPENELAQREELLGRLRQVAGQLVLDIQINRFNVCLTECTSLSLHIGKGGRKIQIKHQDVFISGGLSKDVLTAEIIMSSPIAYLNTTIDFSNPRIINFSVKGGVENIENSTFMGTEGAIQYSGLLKNLNIELEGILPGVGPASVETFLKELEVTALVNGEVNWQISYLDLVLKGHLEPETVFELSIANGLQEVRVLNGFAIDVAYPALDVTSISFLEPVSCIYKLDLLCETNAAMIIATLLDKSLKAYLTKPAFNIQNEAWVFTTSLDVEIFESEETLATLKSHQLQINQQNLMLRHGVASILGVDNIKVEADYNFGSTRGSLKIEIENQMDQILSVADYFEIHELEILRGEMRINSELTWVSSKIAHFDLAFSIKDLDASFLGYTLKGGKANSELSGWPLIVSKNISQFSAETLDIGVELTSLELDIFPVVNMAENTLEIEGERLRGSLFGGNIHSENFRLKYVNEKLDGHLELLINRVSLSEILALERDDIEGSGYISGSVPVQIKDGKLSIENGVMAALDPGGIIKYKPAPSVAASIQGNKSLELIVNVMSDFRYDSLDVGLNYSPEGIMIAKASLKGSNPGFENGREIHFNLNLEENILTLLKSLRLSNQIAKSLKLKGER